MGSRRFCSQSLSRDHIDVGMGRNDKCRFYGASGFKQLTASQWKVLKDNPLPENPLVFNKGSNRGGVVWAPADNVLNGPKTLKNILRPKDVYRMYLSDAAGLASEPVQVISDEIPVIGLHKKRSEPAQPRVREKGVRGAGFSEKSRSTSTMSRRMPNLERRLEVLEARVKKFVDHIEAKTGRAA